MPHLARLRERRRRGSRARRRRGCGAQRRSQSERAGGGASRRVRATAARRCATACRPRHGRGARSLPPSPRSRERGPHAHRRGYSAGLEETIGRLRRDAEDASPVDLSTGALKPSEIIEQLSLEVNRCQRMELSLGLLELALEERGRRRALASRRARTAGAFCTRSGECLRENLRRYDSIGLTPDGGFLLVLPDISRRGLAGAAERLRRELAASAGSLSAAALPLRPGALRLRGRQRRRDARRARPQRAAGARGARAPHLVLTAQASSASPSASAARRTISRSLG